MNRALIVVCFSLALPTAGCISGATPEEGPTHGIELSESLDYLRIWDFDGEAHAVVLSPAGFELRVFDGVEFSLVEPFPPATRFIEDIHPQGAAFAFRSGRDVWRWNEADGFQRVATDTPGGEIIRFCGLVEGDAWFIGDLRDEVSGQFGRSLYRVLEGTEQIEVRERTSHSNCFVVNDSVTTRPDVWLRGAPSPQYLGSVPAYLDENVLETWEGSTPLLIALPEELSGESESSDVVTSVAGQLGIRVAAARHRFRRQTCFSTRCNLAHDGIEILFREPDVWSSPVRLDYHSGAIQLFRTTEGIFALEDAEAAGGDYVYGPF